MNDESHGLSGARLVRARPWALAGTVLLVAGLTLSYTWAWMNLLPGYGPIPSSDPVEILNRWLLLPLLKVLPLVVPLTAVAVLSGRRVTAGRLLLLCAAAAFLESTENALLTGLSFAIPAGLGFEWVGPVAKAAGIVVLILTGLLGRGLMSMPGFPAVRGYRELLVLVLASVLVSLVTVPWQYELGLWAAGVVWALLIVGWAVAALVTSVPERSEWSGDPAELGPQDR